MAAPAGEALAAGEEEGEPALPGESGVIVEEPMGRSIHAAAVGSWAVCRAPQPSLTARVLATANDFGG